MYLSALGVSKLRNIDLLHIELQPGINVFVGPNGSGKTSLLEAAYLLSHAQSFRAGSLESVISRGAQQMELRARVDRGGSTVDLRLVRSREAWSAAVNGQPVASLAEMLHECAVVCLEPGSHALISGSSRERRQFLDWGVFHVEPEFWADMRRYNRVLRQRNAALKQQAPEEILDTWDQTLVEAAQPVLRRRQAYFASFADKVVPLLGQFLPELGEAAATLEPGGGAEDLLIGLRGRRSLDLMRGHTSRGPHRTDWRIAFERAPVREHLSRGQEKLCALACVLAQAAIYADVRGEWPVVALDDLASELDAAHQEAVVHLATAMGAQLLISGTELPPALYDRGAAVFHVEHGRIAGLL